jgi:hypothetical protein
MSSARTHRREVKYLAKENHQESLRKPARRWEDNIKIDFKETV